MTQLTRPPIRRLIPENAPFTAERRTWLDGFFAGFLDLGVATGHAASHRSRVVWIENEGGGGSYFASFRLIPQEVDR